MNTSGEAMTTQATFLSATCLKTQRSHILTFILSDPACALYWGDKKGSANTGSISTIVGE